MAKRASTSRWPDRACLHVAYGLTNGHARFYLVCGPTNGQARLHIVYGPTDSRSRLHVVHSRVQRRRSTTKKRPSTDNTDVWVRRGLVLERRAVEQRCGFLLPTAPCGPSEVEARGDSARLGSELADGLSVSVDVLPRTALSSCGPPSIEKYSE